MSGEDCDPLHVASILDVLVLIERALVGYLVFLAGGSLHDQLTLKLGCQPVCVQGSHTFIIFSSSSKW